MATLTFPTNAFCRNVIATHSCSSARETAYILDSSTAVATLVLTPKSGYTYFDLAPFAKRLFGNDLCDYPAYYKAVSFRYSSESSSTRHTSKIYRSLPQLGDSATYSLPSGYVTLSDFSVLKRWSSLSSAMDHNFVAKTSEGLYIYNTYRDKTIIDACIPDDPFLVRWLNLRGGCDYWCFRKPTFEETLKSFNEYTPYLSDSQITAGRFNRAAYGGELERYATVGSGALTALEAAVVSKIVYSPLIEYWSTDKSKWQRITVKPASLRYTGFFNQSLEITFRMPDIHYLF